MTLAKNQVHQGDCVQLLRRLDEGSVDLVFADPPFNIGYDYDVYDDAQAATDYLDWCRQWIGNVYRCLKPDGTFWLAIGDEYAAELKIESQKAGFHCRSWVIWYYTFGVNCANGFSRSHTHLFHFVKDKKRFTFNRQNPQIRVKSARQLVYADNRANPNGRLPDNTWITRPQDVPEAFSPNHDTWYFARVAGTFKEREGFHGCQMPEQLLGRIIRASSHPQELVVDPFGGSGTTLAVAKKLGRRWMGFELSEDYCKFIGQRLERVQVGDPLDGPSDPVQSAPTTRSGKRKRKKPLDAETEQAVISAYQETADGYPVDDLLCDPERNARFVQACRKSAGAGTGYMWNLALMRLRKSGKLPKSTRRPAALTTAEMDRFGFASEVAWRLMAIDYGMTLDNILCSPEFATEFDRLATAFGPPEVTPRNFRRAALSIRKRSHAARKGAAQRFSETMNRIRRPKVIAIEDCLDESYEFPGVYVLRSNEVGIYVGESENVRRQIETMMKNSNWLDLEPTSVTVYEHRDGMSGKYQLKSALVKQETPLLNCRLLYHESELPNG